MKNFITNVNDQDDYDGLLTSKGQPIETLLGLEDASPIDYFGEPLSSAPIVGPVVNEEALSREAIDWAADFLDPVPSANAEARERKSQAPAVESLDVIDMWGKQ